MSIPVSHQFADLLRHWRNRRRLSQQALAAEAEISTRHLSFLETRRAEPSRDMVFRLAEHLRLPLRERNQLLLAAGFAPQFPAGQLDDVGFHMIREAVEHVLRGHMPYPALAIDRQWNLVSANEAALALMTGVAPELLRPPVNVLRLSLHPQGLAPRIENLASWRAHLLARLTREIVLSADPGLAALHTELCAYPLPPGSFVRAVEAPLQAIVMPMQLHTELGTLSFLSTTTVFGTPLDVTLSELAIESFFPADARTAECLGLLNARPSPDGGSA